MEKPVVWIAFDHAQGDVVHPAPFGFGNSFANHKTRFWKYHQQSQL